MDVVVAGELSRAISVARGWTCKSAQTFVIDVILERVGLEQMQTFCNFGGGIIRFNADKSAPSVSRRAQRDESADAICRFPFLSRVPRQAEWIYIPWGRPGGRKIR